MGTRTIYRRLSWAQRRAVVLTVGAGCLLFACHKKNDDGGKQTAAPEASGGPQDNDVEDLTIVVEADKSRIMQEESALQAKRADFESEKSRLERERSDIAEKLASLSKKDKSQRDKLEAAERQLSDEQKRLRDRSDSFEGERGKLEAEKSKLLERISKMTQTRGGLTIEQREEALARREKDVAQREKEVARREAEAARGLTDLSRVLDEVRNGAAAAARAPVPQVTTMASSMGGPPATRASVQRQQHGIHAKLESKGVLMDDLPPTVRDLDATANAAVSSKDYAAAQDALNQLGQAVDAIAINHAFVQAKMARINRQFDDKKLGNGMDDSKQKKVQGLLAEASDSFSDGRYDRANKKVNQIFALLGGR